MGRYDHLGAYLSEQTGDACTLTFAEVKEIVGYSLPVSAKEYRPWWGNDKTHVQARGWMDAGWKVERLELQQERVHFVRIAPGVPSAGESRAGYATSQVIVRNLDAGVVAELKRRAKRKGRSLERELRIILTRAARPGRAELIAEADRVRAMTPGPLEDSVSLLRQDRDSR